MQQLCVFLSISIFLHIFKHFYGHFHKICSINASKSHSNSTVHQFEAMNPLIFSRYLVIPQYFYFKYRGKVFINTAHPYLEEIRRVFIRTSSYYYQLDIY